MLSANCWSHGTLFREASWRIPLESLSPARRQDPTNCLSSSNYSVDRANSSRIVASKVLAQEGILGVVDTACFVSPNVSCIAGDARSIGMARQPVSFRCVIAMDPITCESRLLTSNSGWHRSAAATSRSYADNEVLAPVSMDEQRPWFDQAVDKHLPGSTLGLRTLRRALLKT